MLDFESLMDMEWVRMTGGNHKLFRNAFPLNKEHCLI